MQSNATLKITILGQPIVKKNNQKVGTNPRTGRTLKYDTPAYREWHRNAVKQTGWGGPPIDSPITLKCHFYMGSRHRTDLSALYEGIQDLLVEQGVLKDDNYTIVASHDGSRVYYDKNNPRIEAWIIPLAEELDV